MIEDTAGYKEMMRMNYGDFCEILNSSFCSAICGVILLSFSDPVLLLALRHFELLFVCDFVDFDCACSHAV